MKDVIFYQVWHPYMHLHIITGKMINIKKCISNYVGCNKLRIMQKWHVQRKIWFYGKIVHIHDISTLKKAYIFLYIIK